MKFCLMLTLCLATSGAGAETVFRCGSTYSQSACPDARTLDVSDARSDAQRSDAQLLPANDQRLGDRLERERLERDATQKKTAASAHPKHSKRPRATKIRWFRP